MPNKNLGQVESIFHAVLDLPAKERAAYLENACQGDQRLYAEVSSLISALDGRKGFLDAAAVTMGMNLLSQSTEQLLTGKTIGSYQVLSRLGSGGMGEVYLAEDTRLGRKVALKFLSREFVGDNWARRQLVKEAQAVAILDHPNICPVHGIEEWGEHSFIVMQYVEGETLADLIRKQSTAPDHMVELARQIVGALAEAHAHGIIHRDIKPRNIMVTPNGNVKVLDFGLAKTVRQKKGSDVAENSISRLSQNGMLAGTVAYMSPEQLRGERLDFRTDIFSLGTVLYEMVEGRRPFARTSEAETISAILTSEPPRLRNLHANFPQLDHIVHKCLEKDRDKRYHSASELLIELGNSPTTRSQTQSRHFLHPWVAAAVAVLLVLVVISVLLYVRLKTTSSNATLPDNNQATPTARLQSLAVMPVTTEDPAKSGEYVSDGLTESLINKFSSLSQLRVSPYTAVSGYKGKTADLLAVGRELNVDAMLLGHIVQRGNAQVLQSKLIKASDGSQLWAGEGEMKWQTIFDLEDQLAKRVVESLELRLVDEGKFLASHGTSSPEAFRQYMYGRYYWKNRDKENIAKAIRYFKEAIRLDPVYARAWAGLADSYVLLSTVSFGKTPTEDAMTQASAAAKEALALDPELAEAHTSLGVVRLRYDWDWQNAESELKRAIVLQPDYAPAHYWYSHLLLILGRHDEAIAESAKAKNLDPSSPPSVMNFCRTLAISRQYDNAIACYDKLHQENPKNEHIEYLLALVYHRSGRSEEALRTFERIYAKDKALAGAALGYAYGKAGRTHEARKVLAEMQDLAKVRYVPPQEFAIIYIGLGDNNNAFAWLEKAYDERFAGLIYLTVEPIFLNLRSDPRYEALVKRLGLPPANLS
jgi:serine/threonine protein kinase/tetratricopeptide (TPR) repeat protein